MLGKFQMHKSLAWVNNFISSAFIPAVTEAISFHKDNSLPSIFVLQIIQIC